VIKRYIHLLGTEFHGYNGKRFLKDAMAGLTVARWRCRWRWRSALAFGVSDRGNPRSPSPIAA